MSQSRKFVQIFRFHNAWVLSVVVVFVWAIFRALASGETQEPKSVNAADIGVKVQIIGKLGTPIGTLMSIRGQWRMPSFGASPPPKPPELQFHVTHLDGKPLSKETIYFASAVRAINLKDQRNHEADGVVWEMRAFEGGQFVNLAERHWQEFYKAPVSALDYGQGPFACFLTGNVTNETQPPVRSK
jgi:hypothetical protein